MAQLDTTAVAIDTELEKKNVRLKHLQLFHQAWGGCMSHEIKSEHEAPISESQWVVKNDQQLIYVL